MRNESEKRGEKNFLKIFEFWNSKEGSFALKSTKQELFIQPHISPFSSPMISRKRKSTDLFETDNIKSTKKTKYENELDQENRDNFHYDSYKQTFCNSFFRKQNQSKLFSEVYYNSNDNSYFLNNDKYQSYSCIGICKSQPSWINSQTNNEVEDFEFKCEDFKVELIFQNRSVFISYALIFSFDELQKWVFHYFPESRKVITSPKNGFHLSFLFQRQFKSLPIQTKHQFLEIYCSIQPEDRIVIILKN